MRVAPGGTVAALSYDDAAATVTLRVDGGAFNAGEAEYGWGHGDFVLVFARVTEFDTDGADPAGGELLEFASGGSSPAGKGEYRLRTTAGLARWRSRLPVMSWYLPRRA